MAPAAIAARTAGVAPLGERPDGGDEHVALADQREHASSGAARRRTPPLGAEALGQRARAAPGAPGEHGRGALGARAARRRGARCSRWRRRRRCGGHDADGHACVSYHVPQRLPKRQRRCRGPADRRAGTGKEHMSDVTRSPSRSAERRSRSRPASWPSRPPAPSSSSGRHGGAQHRHRRQPARRRLPPADGGRRGAHVRRGQDPRLVLQARGSRRREGHARRPHDRPAAAPALPQGLAPRDAARERCRCRSTTSHPYDILGDERRLRRADDLRHPVPDAGRRRAHRQGRRQLRRQPDRGAARTSPTSTWSSPAPTRRS